jgi:DivIVA domain-containing protein
MDEIEAPRFTVTFRGYDRVQVDAYVRSLLQDSGAPPQGGGAPPQGGEVAGLDTFFKDAPLREFDVVFRGYDRKEVDRFVAEQERRIRG